MKEKITLVWLKRDLRISDHEPFARAIELGLPIYAFYLLEPNLLRSLDVDIRHLRFIRESIREMNLFLQKYHAKVHVHRIEIIPFLEKVLSQYEIAEIFSHQETGTRISFDRDIAVGKFLRYKGIPWIESKSSYIVRGLKSGRMGWKEKWKSWMEALTIHPHWEKARERHYVFSPKETGSEEKSGKDSRSACRG